MQNITVILDVCADNNVLGVLVVNGHSQKEVQEQFRKYTKKYEDEWTVDGFVEHLKYDLEWSIGWYNEINVMVV